jgi:hypothetical protein
VTSGWRGFGTAVGLILVICGIAFWSSGGGPFLLIAGVVALITALLEPIYGKAGAKPLAGNWRPTDERFVDSESGKLVTVWFDPSTGERRYVDDQEPA